MYAPTVVVGGRMLVSLSLIHIFVEGELTSRSYEDKDGNRRKAVEITVDSVHFCDSKKDGGQSSGSDFADPGYSEGSSDFTEIEGDGDLPF